ADFQDLDSVFYILDQQNTFDTCVFLINPGLYYFDIDMGAFNTDHPLTFKCSNGVPMVSIIGSGGFMNSFKLKWAYNTPRPLITFENLIFMNSVSNTSS